jgi:hypothetical protein
VNVTFHLQILRRLTEPLDIPLSVLMKAISRLRMRLGGNPPVAIGQVDYSEVRTSEISLTLAVFIIPFFIG